MKKYPHLLLIPIAFFLLMSGSRCRKKCSCDESYKKIPESTKEWFWFGEGSTWVYRLAEDTTVFDTMTLVLKKDESSNKFCESEFAPAIACSEVLNLILKHTNAKYFPATTIDSINAGNDIIYVYTPSGGGEFIDLQRPRNEGVILGLPIRLGEKYDQYTLQDTFSNFQLLNKTYHSVIHSATKIVPPYTYAAEVWWAKKIGLLKIIKIAGVKPKTTWELIKFEIK